MSETKKEWKPGPWRASGAEGLQGACAASRPMAGESDTEALFMLFERAESEKVRAALDKVREEEAVP